MIAPIVKTRVDVDWAKGEIRVYDLRTGDLMYSCRIDKHMRREA